MLNRNMEKGTLPIGQLLIEKGLITPEQLETALNEQKKTKELLGVVLMKLGFIDQETIFLPVVAGQWGVDYLDLKTLEIDGQVIHKLPAKFAMHYKVIPVQLHDRVLTLATTEPFNIQMLDEISLLSRQYLSSLKECFF